jgi:hypothetical protein
MRVRPWYQAPHIGLAMRRLPAPLEQGQTGKGIGNHGRDIGSMVFGSSTISIASLVSFVSDGTLHMALMGTRTSTRLTAWSC